MGQDPGLLLTDYDRRLARTSLVAGAMSVANASAVVELMVSILARLERPELALGSPELGWEITNRLRQFNAHRNAEIAKIWMDLDVAKLTGEGPPTFDTPDGLPKG